MALFKKEVKSKYIPISDLVEGEIYKCSFPSMRVFMYEKLESVIGYKYLIANSQWFLKDSCISDKVYFSTIQKATLVDKMHLEACIEANRYISLIDALQVSKVELKFEKGAFVEYLGTDASNELWNQYFGCYDIVKGDVGVISSVYDKNNIYVKDAFGSQGECKLTDKDLRLITEEEYKAKLRHPIKQVSKTKEVEKWSRGTYVVFKVGDYIEYLGTKRDAGTFEEYFGRYGVEKGDVGIVAPGSINLATNAFFVKDNIRNSTSGVLYPEDIKHITKKEFDIKNEAQLRRVSKTNEVEKWSRGTYVVFLEDDLQGNFKKKGCVEEVVACYKYSLQIDIVYRDGYSNAIEGEVSVADKIKWFATKQEAEIFSKELLGNKPNLKANTGKFKAGDKVKVVRKAKDYEGDWVDTWISTPIGSIKTIERTVGNRGYIMREGFNYPEFVLELVEEKKDDGVLTTKDLRLITEEEYKSKLRYPEESKSKEVEKWSKGTYVVFLDDGLESNGKSRGGVEIIHEDHIEDHRSYIIYENGCANTVSGKDNVADKIKWFATESEAKAFSKDLLNKKPDLKANTGKFKIGDKVKVLRSAISTESDWDNTWVYEMHESIGKTLYILYFGVKYHNGYYLSDGYEYPEFVLELVEENKNSKTDIHIHKGNTDDEVYEGEIYVDDEDLFDCNSEDICGNCKGTDYGDKSNNSIHHQCEGSWCQEAMESWKEDNIYPGHKSIPVEMILETLDSEILSSVEKTKLPEVSVLSFDDED